MKKTLILLSLIITMLSVKGQKPNSAVIPAHHLDRKGWRERHEVMPDYLHPNLEGNKLLSETLVPGFLQAQTGGTGQKKEHPMQILQSQKCDIFLKTIVRLVKLVGNLKSNGSGMEIQNRRVHSRLLSF